MIIDIPQKNKILTDVNEFYKNIASKYNKARYYVDTESATDIASFFSKIFEARDKKFDRIIDLTSGSANLTSHIVLDNDIDFVKLIFNDKNLDHANSIIGFGDPSNKDVLNHKDFAGLEPFDLIIFNPLIGGTVYPEGMLISSLPECIFHSIHLDPLSALSDYVDLSDTIICIDEEEKSIIIRPNIALKPDIESRLKSIKIFNYYDVFYLSKQKNKEIVTSEIVKFRKTFDSISKDNTIVVFLGEENQYRTFFYDYNDYKIYFQNKGKPVIIGQKNDHDSRVCYKKEKNEFVEFICDTSSSQDRVDDDIDLSDMFKDIHQHLQEIKALDDGELFILEEKTGISTESPKPESIASDKQKPFKNFLLKLFIKETE